MLSQRECVRLLGAQLQVLVSMASERNVQGALDYWAGQPHAIGDIARLWREWQASSASSIINASGKDVKEFVDAIPQMAGPVP